MGSFSVSVKIDTLKINYIFDEELKNPQSSQRLDSSFKKEPDRRRDGAMPCGLLLIK